MNEEPPVPPAAESSSLLGPKRQVGPEDPLAKNDLTLLVLLREQLQKLRIAEGNRAKAAAERHEDERFILHQEYEARLLEFEESIARRLKPLVEQHAAWEWLKGIHGVSYTSAALVLGHIDISRCDTVSSLWRFAGYAVVEGKRERPTKGQALPYNARLKTMVWRLIDLQVKTRGPYRKTYDDAKHRYITTRSDWTLGHCEAAARRVAAKLFLSHLWQVWRQAEGLSTRGPWIEQYGGGQHDIIDPWEFIAVLPVEPAIRERAGQGKVKPKRRERADG